jgi:hypothetical protein
LKFLLGNSDDGHTDQFEDKVEVSEYTSFMVYNAVHCVTHTYKEDWVGGKKKQ